MNGYKRTLGALHFEKTDCVPTWGGYIVSADFFSYITGKNFWDDPFNIAVEAYRKLETDMLIQNMYLPDSPEDYRKHGHEVIDGSEKFKTPEDVVQYINSLPDPATLEKEFDFEKEYNSISREYQQRQAVYGDDIFCMPSCPTCRFVWYMNFGYESYLMAAALYPDSLNRLFEYSAEEGRLLNTVRVQLINDNKLPPFFFTGQDICGHKGPIMSPEALRSLYFPNLRRSVEPLVDAGADIIWHSDGYIIPILDDLIGCGVAGFQGFQEWLGFDIGEIAARTTSKKRRPFLMAGLSVDKALPFGTVNDVKKEVERIIDTVGADGGLIIGTANTAGPDCPSENLEALHRYVHQYSQMKEKRNVSSAE